jgi:ABC-2 type transport system ATP-binding protein
MQRLIGRPWFRRRRVGVGWRPASWQGWLATVLAVAIVIAVIALVRGSSRRIPIVILVVAVYVAVAVSTSGTDAEARETEEPAADARAEGVRPRVKEHGALPPAAARRDELHASGTPALVVEQLTKRFGDRTAVAGVSFSVAAGEVFGFLGPNGAGKTTTVRMLGTLISPTSGSAVVAGIPLAPENGVEIRQRIAIMPENPGLYLRLTVAENLEFFADLYGLRHPQPRIRQALESIDLADRANDLCGSLSKGLRQRVGLARALLDDPAIIFLDEPTSGLDPVASHEVHELIDGLRGRGTTVFLTTHRLEEAERLCDRVAILSTSLRTIGRPDELRDRLFSKNLLVETAAPLDAPEQVFAGLAGVESWRSDGPAGYELAVSDLRLAAPAVARALVAAGADLLSLAEARRSLEDVYLELIDGNIEARR